VALRSSQAPHGSTKLSFCGTVSLGFDPVRQWWCSFLRENPNELRHQGRGIPKFYPPLQHEPRFQCTAPERRPRPPPLAILRERLFLNSGSERVPLAIRDMRRRNGERRSRAPKSRRGFSFPIFPTKRAYRSPASVPVVGSAPTWPRRRNNWGRIYRAKHTGFSLGFAANFSRGHPTSSHRTGTNRFR
jgi:hypothetical protein